MKSVSGPMRQSIALGIGDGTDKARGDRRGILLDQDWTLRYKCTLVCAFIGRGRGG